MNLSDLQRKDVVSLEDGRRLGRIFDARVSEVGVIEGFTVMNYRFWKFWKTNNEITITFSQIKKIGSDVILVDV